MSERSWEVPGTRDLGPFWKALEESGISREDANNMFVSGSHRYPCDADQCEVCPRIRRQ